MKLKFRESNSYGQLLGAYVYNSKNEHLGDISFYKSWRCFVWVQKEDTIMSSECLQQIVDKLKELGKRLFNQQVDNTPVIKENPKKGG